MTKNSLQLNLTQFIKTGKFNFISLGVHKNELLANGFYPDDWLNNETIESSKIWKYGNFEFHFDNNSSLKEILNNYVPKLDGGKKIHIQDWWLFKEGKYIPNLKETIKELDKLDLKYSKEIDLIGFINIKFENQVYIVFENLKEINSLDLGEFKMVVIGKKK
ncbi:hypothetical protein FIA58_008320 [Flavobacterium jejuense]|uniref:Uncharacterized protein n=1 Tax=Flavobacterium jejuense TaxID=1544455 RepID=A0ABX0IR40_9FLAO|nr:hypothetical protein [Flavobacterium jejuense]NHN25681.1 hypothetical protein [Flavobacterium jejuense]